MKLLLLKKKKVLIGLLVTFFILCGYMAVNMISILNDGANERDEAVISEIGAEPDLMIDAEIDSPDLLSLGDNKEEKYDDYFVNYRIEREKVRSQQIELLREIVDNPNSVSEVRKNAQEKMLTITQNMENELKLENLIKAKNYQDAVVLIQPESVMVVIKILELAVGDGTKIADIVANTTGHNYEDIIITTKE